MGNFITLADKWIHKYKDRIPAKVTFDVGRSLEYSQLFKPFYLSQMEGRGIVRSVCCWSRSPKKKSIAEKFKP